MQEVLSVTGHRPDKFNGDYDGVFPLALNVRLWFEEQFTLLQPKMVIWGGALGVDTWAAEEALKLDIPLHLAIPFEGFNSSWTRKGMLNFNHLATQSTEITVVNERPYRPWYFQKRNEFMVDNSDKLLAVWNGSKGGTWNCVSYARRRKHPIEYFTDPTFPSNPSELHAPLKDLIITGQELG